MPDKTTPAPPSHLSSGSSEWWSEVCGTYSLEPHHLRLLQLAAEAWDRGEQARRAIKREGAFYTDRFGAPKAHPGLDQERKARNDFRLLLRELGLDDAPDPSVVKPVRARGRDFRRVG